MKVSNRQKFSIEIVHLGINTKDLSFTLIIEKIGFERYHGCSDDFKEKFRRRLETRSEGKKRWFVFYWIGDL